MDAPTSKTCPKCGSNDYVFRSRKKLTGESGEGMETKYRCKGCGHEWKVQTMK